MIIKDFFKAPASVERAAVAERPTTSLGQKVIGYVAFGLALLLLIAFVTWRLWGRLDQNASQTNIAATAPPAADSKGPGDLNAPPDITKPCPPGIVCDGKPPKAEPAAAKAEGPDLEEMLRLQREQQAALQLELAITRRLGSSLTERKENSGFAGEGRDAGNAGGIVRTNFNMPATVGVAPAAGEANSTFVYPQTNTPKAQATPVAVAPVNELAQQLMATSTPGSSAGMLPNRSLMVAKGQSSTCVLDTALSSEQLGFVRCVLDYPIMSADGKVTMMERGTTVDGEYKKGVDRGVRAAFVLWTRAVTPDGVYINLDSPATDGLGRSGVPGEVDSRFWDRYKGALLFSILQDVGQIGTGMLTAFGVTGPYGIPLPQNTATATSSVASEIMKRDADVKDVLNTNQGKVIGITIARDLDFSTVYNLKLKRRS